MGLHFSWFIRSLRPGGHTAAPVTLRRILVLVFGMPIFISLQLAHWLGLFIDEICFRGYRKVKIKAPLFITGIPRSGTTFAHRSVAADRSSYCTVSTWEAILAPSITERKLLVGLRFIDRLIGSPLKRTVHHLLTKASGDFNTIHEVGLNAPEEDYLWLLPAGSCFILSMAFPFSRWLSCTVSPEKFPQEQRDQLLDFYISCIQRHLYHHGTNRHFLSKNAAFSRWIGLLAERLPDARFLVCVRHPGSALSSQLSSLRPARELFATDPDGNHTRERITNIFTANYKYLEQITKCMPDNRIAVIDQLDLRNHGASIINTALDRLSLPSRKLRAETNSTKKKATGNLHKHSAPDQGLKNQEIEICLLPHYRAIIQSKQRIQPPTQQHGTEP